MGGGPRGLPRRRRRHAGRRRAPARRRCRRARCSRSSARTAADLLVPMVRDAIRSVDVAARRHRRGRRIPRRTGRMSACSSTSSRSSRNGSTGSASSATSPTRSRPGNELRALDLREHTPLSGGQVDDTPFGGGAGMVLRVDVMDAGAARLLRRRPGGPAARAARDRADARAAGSSTRRWSTSWPPSRRVTLLCGRYEGFDERIVQHFCSDAVSIGRYVLAGGELAAMVVCDAVLRKLPGALGHADSAVGGVLQRGARRRSGVPALHAPGGVPRLERAGRAAVRPSRGDPSLAPRAQPRARGDGRRVRRGGGAVGRGGSPLIAAPLS